MADKNSMNKYLSKLKSRYRFVIMTESAFEEKSSLTFSLLHLILSVFCVIAIIVVVTLLIFGGTPLKKYIPGKSSEEVQKSLITLSLQADSLKRSIDQGTFFLNNLNNIISGKTSVHIDSVSKALTKEDVVFQQSKEDSLFRRAVELEDKKSISLTKPVPEGALMFFCPLNGIISDSFNERIKHFGIDIVAKEQARIKSVLDGVVVISHWTDETGFVIGVQHDNNYFSLYKHNSSLLKSVGDFVRAGENIAIIGNSGELTTGAHLHFELWHNGGAVNPTNFINFKK